MRGRGQKTISPVAVIIPYGGTDRYRYLAWRAVLAYYRANFPGWAVYTSQMVQPADLTAETFSRAAEINRLAANVTEPVLVINDADTLCPPAAVMDAYRQAVEKPGLVRAYSRYRKLTQAATDLLHSQPGYWGGIFEVPDSAIQWEQEPAYAHGCAITRRECFEQVGGYDPKFVGWGYEDCAAELIFDAHFEPDRRVRGDLFHFWHPGASGQESERRNADLYYRLYEPWRGNAERLAEVRAMTPEEAEGYRV